MLITTTTGSILIAAAATLAPIGARMTLSKQNVTGYRNWECIASFGSLYFYQSYGVTVFTCTPPIGLQQHPSTQKVHLTGGHFVDQPRDKQLCQEQVWRDQLFTQIWEFEGQNADFRAELLEQIGTPDPRPGWLGARLAEYQFRPALVIAPWQTLILTGLLAAGGMSLLVP